MKKRDYLRADELEKLLAAAKLTRNPERDYCLVLLSYRHGLRVGEACALKLSDVNLELGELYVHRAKGSVAGSHPFFNGESGAIKAWLGVRSQMGVPEGVDTLFVSEQRRPLNRVSVWYLLKNLAREAGLESLGVRPHMLRHSCGYSLVNKGTDLRLIQNYLGHKSVSSTVRYTAVDTKRYARLF